MNNKLTNIFYSLLIKHRNGDRQEFINRYKSLPLADRKAFLCFVHLFVLDENEKKEIKELMRSLEGQK